MGQSIGNTAVKLLPDEASPRGLTANAVVVLRDAAARGKISPSDIASLIPRSVRRDRGQLVAVVAWLGEHLKSSGTRIVPDAEVKVLSIGKTRVRTNDETRVRLVQQKPRKMPKLVDDGAFERGLSIFSDLEEQYKDDPFGSYLVEIGKFPILSFDQEQELGRRILEEEDLEARNQLVEHNLRLVVWVARKYFGRHKMNMMDKIGNGNLGLITAADRFDYRKGNKFSTYATWWIRQAMGRGILDQGDMIRLPVHVHEANWKIMKTAERLEKENGQRPSVREVAKVSGLSRKDIKRVRSAMKIRVLSIDDSFTGHSTFEPSETSLVEILMDEKIMGPEVSIEAAEELEFAQAKITEILKLLKEGLSLSLRDIDIFKCFYGLDGSGNRRTLDATGQLFGITRERIRQVIANIWKRADENGSDMDHDRMLEELKRVEELEKLVAVAASL